MGPAGVGDRHPSDDGANLAAVVGNVLWLEYGDVVPALLRFEHQGERRVSSNRNPLYGIHLHADFHVILWSRRMLACRVAIGSKR